MKTSAVLLAVVSLAFVTSCYGGPTYTERVTQKYELFTPESYKVGVGDVLEVTLVSQTETGEPTANRELVRSIRVLPDGTIDYLFNDVTGELMVAGKTAPEVARMLEKQIVEKNRLYSGAGVSVLILSSASSLYYVAGEVKTPGAFPLDQPVTVVQAIVRAGWFTEFADRKHIQIIRREGDREIRMTFNYTDYEQRPGRTKYDDIMLHPNDTVLVPD
jgi:polysaccharide export outer membrane protein